MLQKYISTNTYIPLHFLVPCRDRPIAMLDRDAIESVMAGSLPRFPRISAFQCLQTRDVAECGNPLQFETIAAHAMRVSQRCHPALLALHAMAHRLARELIMSMRVIYICAEKARRRRSRAPPGQYARMPLRSGRASIEKTFSSAGVQIARSCIPNDSVPLGHLPSIWRGPCGPLIAVKPEPQSSRPWPLPASLLAGC